MAALRQRPRFPDSSGSAGSFWDPDAVQSFWAIAAPNEPGAKEAAQALL
jgi:hypothetical protein